MENKLCYKKEAENFEEALPLGNGYFGAMVYGGTKKEKLSLNLDTLWSGKKTEYKSDTAPDAFKKARELTLEGKIQEAEELMAEKFHNLWSAYYLPMASIFIERSEILNKNYYRELDISTAVSKTEFGDIKNECFLSKPDETLIFTEKSENKRDYTITLDTKLRNIIKIKDNSLILNGRCPSECGMRWDSSEPIRFKYKDDEGITFTLIVKIVTDGIIKSRGNYLIVQNASEINLIIAAKSSFISALDPYSFEHEKRCLEIIKNALNKGINKIKEDHVNDHNSLYNRTSLNLMGETIDKPTDERLKNTDKYSDKGLTELLFNYGKYLTIASSREGSEATNLQGIWNEHLFAPWRSNYTVNINTEMNYWPTLMLDLYECHEPLISLIKKISVTGKAAAKNFYSAEGFVSHHNVDLWGHASPVGGFNNFGANHYASWNLSSGWLCAHLFWHYEYTNDKEFLKNTAYPIMKEAAKFYLDIMTETETELFLCPSSSPENDYIGDDGKTHCLAKKTTMSQSIIKELFVNLIKASEILGIDSDFASILKEKVKKISPYQIGSDGRLIEWDREYKENEVTHRHLSHLYGLFPGEDITTETTPELTEAVKKSLEVRGDAGTGWSLGWKVNLWAKLKDGDRTLKLVHDQLNFVDTKGTDYHGHGGTYSNMMDAHPPFQIDGNFGVTSGIIRMFLQHECGKIKILPALPSSFTKGSIKGIKTKGNVSVSISWENGKAISVIFLSPVSQNVKAEVNGTVYDISLNADEEFRVV